MHLNDEEARLEALHRLNLLDTDPSESFDRITRMASQIFGLPIAAVSLTDRDRQWFKSRVGITHFSIPRHKAPCAEVAETTNTVLIPDLHASSCYRNSILAEQGIRFYAGASLTTRDGHGLGALCVLGTEPREATDDEMNALSDLAGMVMAQIELQHAFGRLDPLSGLPNRNQFLDDLADLGHERPGEQRLVTLIDLAPHEQLSDGMRVIGAIYLEQIVMDAARVLCAKLGPGRTVYHVAATQFAFLAPAGAHEVEYLSYIREESLHSRGTSGNRFAPTASIGVAPFITGETPPATVLRTAHTAALEARAHSSLVSFYSPSADSTHQRRFRILNDFNDALNDDEQLSLAFQPRMDLVTGECVGAEALLRWQHPELGSISPAEFMPVIEQTSLIGPTTKWVLDAALAQLAKWRAAGVELQLSINISAVNLHDRDFAQQVQLHLFRHHVRPEWVELEVTESAVMGNVANAMLQLGTLVEVGVHVAIDDFGTGHSSLAYLQQLPGSVLKIDRTFMRDISQGERERTLVRSMISLAHDLSYRVVAEGVETADAVDLLIGMGCDEAQGFFFGRPMAADAFNAWLDALSVKIAGLTRAA
ncbi:EAL domain-containing protein [Novosphingobium sp. RD2P27]|uniref:EAL domain-containing protein n=1 Tax=Novosphingobium kalidii TaxID=3230299 RepID=A0ABV2CZA8_9SPHN